MIHRYSEHFFKCKLLGINENSNQNLGRMQLVFPKLHSKTEHLGEEAITKGK